MIEFDYTLRTIAMGSAVLGIVSGALGSFAVLRGQSLLGDAISHAALPGIGLAFLLTGLKVPIVLMLGAAVAGWLGTLVVMQVTSTTRVKYDSSLGLVLSVFFGFGLVLLTFIQRLPEANQAGLDRFLFGQAAALVRGDVVTMSVLGAATLLLLALFWKEFKVLSFDPEFGQTMGLPIRTLDVLLTTLLVVAIVIGLQTVGVVLMSAMVVAPAGAARQWTDRLGLMVILAAFFGAVAGVSGALLSSTTANLPTGPTIVLCMAVLVVVSIFLAPNRGLVWRRVHDVRQARRLRLEAVLLDLYALAQQHDRVDHPHEQSVLDAMSERGVGAGRSLGVLEERGFVRRVGPGRWALTDAGLERAQDLLRQHRSA